jgi:FKBP-type peptidyl-prolyl cis-trans isomerase SlyD
MQIADQTVVSLQYVLSNAKGEVIDQSTENSPLLYLHGAGNLVVGVEQALAGKCAGDALEVEVPPEKGYGERDEGMVAQVPRSELPEGEIDLGTQFQVEHSGGVGVVTVTAIEGDTLTVDGNHPLAGETLHFALSVVEVRAATPEELEHGHVHGPGGHHH